MLWEAEFERNREAVGHSWFIVQATQSDNLGSSADQTIMSVSPLALVSSIFFI